MVVGVLSALVVTRFTASEAAPTDPVPWWPLLPAAAVGAATCVNVRLRKSFMAITLAETVLVFALIHLPPVPLLVVLTVGQTVELIRERHSPGKIAFNFGMILASTAVAVAVFHGLGAGAADGPVRWALCLAAASMASLVSASMVSAMIRVYDGEAIGIDLRDAVAPCMVAGAVNTALGLVLSEVYRSDPRSLLLLAPIGAALALAYRAHAKLQGRTTALEVLHTSVLELSSAPDLRNALERLVGRSREAVAADVGLVVILRDGDGGLRDPDALVVGRDDLVRSVALGPETIHVLQAVASGPGTASIGSDDPIYDVLDAHEVLAAELRTDHGLAGLVVVGRAARVHPFARTDLQLLQALATHAATVLRLGAVGTAHAQLRAERVALEHDANHDPLTGLANRRALLGRLDDLADDGRTACGIVYLDLDGFKPVNDRYGHGAGDLVLVEVAQRLRSTVRPGDLVARLGGDEFAVLVEGPTHLDGLAEMVRRLQASFGPIELPGIGDPVTVRASIGAAVGDLTEEAPAALVARADEAMYRAKAERRSSDVGNR